MRDARRTPGCCTDKEKCEVEQKCRAEVRVSFPGKLLLGNIIDMKDGPSDEIADTFQIGAGMVIAAKSVDVFDYVSDLERIGEWSPECRGGIWLNGGPGRVGSVFQGRNLRATEVVSWAPIVRGQWTTEAEIVQVDPPYRFAWAMRDSAGQRQDSVWSFEVRPKHGTCELIHAFRMGQPTEGIRQIFGKLTPAEAEAFVADWTKKLNNDIRVTLANVKAALE